MSVLSKRQIAPRRQRVVKNPLPWYTPRFWHGMRFSTWTGALLRHRLAISPSRLPMALSITGFSALNSALAALTQVCFGRRIEGVRLAIPPLFILGHWRSGTTLLHELLICDPAHAYPTTYQCFAPHHFVLSERMVTGWTDFLLPSRRPMDNMAAGWDRPQEDEFALGNLGVPSPYLSMMFPNQGEKYSEYLTLGDVAPRELARWQAELFRFFQRLALRDQRRIVVKSPPHTARIQVLRQLFPDARFVHISRRPEALYASTLALWRSLHESQGLQTVRNDSWLENYVVQSLKRMYDAYLRDRPTIPTGQLAELRYEDLIDCPLEKLREIYRKLDLGDFAAVAGPVQAYLADVKNYRVNHHEVAPETAAMLRQQWADYYREFGYDA